MISHGARSAVSVQPSAPSAVRSLSAWSVDDDGTITLDVVVPANTDADVWVPGAGDDSRVGATPYAVHRVEPGRHRFTGRLRGL